MNDIITNINKLLISKNKKNNDIYIEILIRLINICSDNAYILSYNDPIDKIINFMINGVFIDSNILSSKIKYTDNDKFKSIVEKYLKNQYDVVNNYIIYDCKIDNINTEDLKKFNLKRKHILNLQESLTVIEQKDKLDIEEKEKLEKIKEEQ